MLQAPYEVVGYIDVSDVQTQFFDWCTQPGRAAAGRLIYGPGGLGKTRLMVSLAARLRNEEGWTAGFLDRPRDSSEPALKQRWQAIEQLIHHGDGDDRGLLIVVDYAEARQDEVRALARCLCERSDSEIRPIRLVLLARSAGEWWTTLHAETPDIQRVFRGDDPAAVMELPAVSTGALRLALFEASLRDFRQKLDPLRVTEAGTPSEAYLGRIETDSEFSRPLAIQMAALVCSDRPVLARRPRPRASSNSCGAYLVWNATTGERSWATSTTRGAATSHVPWRKSHWWAAP